MNIDTVDDQTTLLSATNEDLKDGVFHFPEGAGITSIAANAFSLCTNLTSIIIPDGVTSIGAYAFYGCENLKHIKLPVSVASADPIIFANCQKLSHIFIDTDEVGEINRFKKLFNNDRWLYPRRMQDLVLPVKLFQLQQEVLNRFCLQCPSLAGLAQVAVPATLQGVIAQFNSTDYPEYKRLSNALAQVSHPASDSDYEHYQERLSQICHEHIGMYKRQHGISRLQHYIETMEPGIPANFRDGKIKSTNQQNQEVVQTYTISKQILAHFRHNLPLDLTIADYQLIRRKPKLLEILATTQTAAHWEAQYTNLLNVLKGKTDELILFGEFEPRRYSKTGDVAKTLIQELTDAGKAFFANPDKASATVFQDACHAAIGAAEGEFKKNRSPGSISYWNELNPILKGIIGILALLTVIPAVIISATSTHGYAKTFFAKCPTDSWEKLHAFEKRLEQLHINMEDAADEDTVLDPALMV